MCVCVTPFITTLLPALHFPLSRNTITTSWQRAAHLLPHYKSPSTDSIFEMQKQSLCAGSRYSNDSGASADAAKIEIWVNIHDSDTEKDTYTDGGSLLTCTSWMHPSLTSSSTHFHCRCLGFPSFPPFLFCPSPLIPPPLSVTLFLYWHSEFTGVPAEDLAGAEILGMKTKVVSGKDKKGKEEFWRDKCPKRKRKADVGSFTASWWQREVSGGLQLRLLTRNRCECRWRGELSWEWRFPARTVCECVSLCVYVSERKI